MYTIGNMPSYTYQMPIYGMWDGLSAYDTYTNSLGQNRSVQDWITYYKDFFQLNSNIFDSEIYVRPKAKAKPSETVKHTRTTGSTATKTQQSRHTENKSKAAAQTKTNPNARTVNLSKEFVDKVKDIAKKINLEDYNDLLALINAESGFSTTARSGGKRDGAVGLIQFTDIAIKDLNQVYGLNLTKDKIASMSDMEQLDLVEKYLVRAKKIAKFKGNDKLTGNDLYAIVYMPARAKESIVAQKSDGKYYTKNEGLDQNGDGYIAKAELRQQLEKFSVNVNLIA